MSVREFAAVGVLSTAVKLLLTRCYRSTDFEVHRNWLAITHSLPLKLWYFETTSEWTLDYPPLFAYFEWLLSQIAVRFDPKMVQISSEPYASDATVYFQRGSVMITDCLLMFATWRYIHSRTPGFAVADGIRTFAFVSLNAGLLLVDHIHFQYNGMLLGLLVLCFDFANRKQHLALAACFSVLVLMKHLFVFLAPVFGVYLIRMHCIKERTITRDSKGSPSLKTPSGEGEHRSAMVRNGSSIESLITSSSTKARNGTETQATHRVSSTTYSFSVERFIELVAVAGTALAAAFGPFILQEGVGNVGQLTQIFSRLFPFGRGLVHAYWAPNVWALYCAADRACSYLVRKALTSDSGSSSGSFVVQIAKTLAPFIISSSGSSQEGDFSFLASDLGTATRSGFVSSTSGLVGDFALGVLPRITPAMSMLLTLFSMTPALIVLVTRPSPHRLVLATAYCSLCSFMLGYHVHEKAILIPMICLALVAVDSKSCASLYLCVAAVGTYGLFPLFTEIPELVVKMFLTAAMVASTWSALPHLEVDSFSVAVTNWWITGYTMILAAAFLFSEIAHPLLFVDAYGERTLPFLPLLVTSTVCAVLLLPCWLQAAYLLFEDDPRPDPRFIDTADEDSALYATPFNVPSSPPSPLNAGPPLASATTTATSLATDKANLRDRGKVSGDAAKADKAVKSPRTPRVGTPRGKGTKDSSKKSDESVDRDNEKPVVTLKQKKNQ